MAEQTSNTAAGTAGSAPQVATSAPTQLAPTAAEEAGIQIEESAQIENDNADADSAYDSELASYTTSLASAVTDYKMVHGRRYHAHKEGAYIFPNDEQESDRMDIAHKWLEITMGGKLYFSPLEEQGKAPPRRVLDVGTGTGIWAMEMADKFPNAEVVGNDLSPIQPRWVPPNVRFEVDDLEAEWTYSTPFDFIHARQLYAAVYDWPRLMKQTMDHLRPGGYAEFVDLDANWTSPDGTVTDETMVRQCGIKFCELNRKAGREPNPGSLLEGWMRDAGFEDIHARRIPLPLGTWPADKQLKESGAWNFLQFNEGIDGFITYVFTSSGEYTKEECDVMAARCRKDAKDPKIHAMFWLYVVYGKKPGGENEPATG